MAVHQVNPQGNKVTTLDPIWDHVRQEAEDILRREPELASFIYATVLHHERLEDSVVHRIASRLDHSSLSGDLIRQTFDEALRDDPDLVADVQAAVDDANQAVSRAESIRKFRILDVDFTQEAGQLTVKLGIRRSVLLKDFAADIDALYS